MGFWNCYVCPKAGLSSQSLKAPTQMLFFPFWSFAQFCLFVKIQGVRFSLRLMCTSTNPWGSNPTALWWGIFLLFCTWKAISLYPNAALIKLGWAHFLSIFHVRMSQTICPILWYSRLPFSLKLKGIYGKLECNECTHLISWISENGQINWDGYSADIFFSNNKFSEKGTCSNQSKFTKIVLSYFSWWSQPLNLCHDEWCHMLSSFPRATKLWPSETGG